MEGSFDDNASVDLGIDDLISDVTPEGNFRRLLKVNVPGGANAAGTWAVKFVSTFGTPSALSTRNFNVSVFDGLPTVSGLSLNYVVTENSNLNIAPLIVDFTEVQWFKGDTEVGTGSGLGFNPIAISDADTYTLIASSPLGTTSYNVSIAVNREDATAIVTAPSGEMATAASVNFQWTVPNYLDTHDIIVSDGVTSTTVVDDHSGDCSSGCTVNVTTSGNLDEDKWL